MITFKQFMNNMHSSEESEQSWEDLAHHIAEEELVSCKVLKIEKENGSLKVIADCNDKPRSPGYQPDLSFKLTARLTLHKLPGLGVIDAKVYHKDADPR